MSLQWWSLGVVTVAVVSIQCRYGVVTVSLRCRYSCCGGCVLRLLGAVPHTEADGYLRAGRPVADPRTRAQGNTQWDA